MSRKSRLSPVTFNFSHVLPPSIVRKTVLPEPLAHATRSLTALTPRSRALTLLVCGVQCGAMNIHSSRKQTRFMVVGKCVPRSCGESVLSYIYCAYHGIGQSLQPDGLIGSSRRSNPDVSGGDLRYP